MLSPNKLSPIFKLRNEILDKVQDLAEYRLGKILTIIDASIADPEQRKGIKDLIRNSYYEQEYWTEGIRTWLWEYVKKYVPEQAGDEDGFMGRISAHDKQTPRIEYFED